ncbi:hypothetical protein OF829_00515 [Sphingomonas sp. LB-2]|uniref:hypothetical protein n=1 Tax=Sphingomonas caeni TaxID=2984949 RepID=UPI00222F9596|nr:hypothetical protein [Sphingomonas caeni]MCW3845703.1 hypothetical protein [Sphingomonas caeni]
MRVAILAAATALLFAPAALAGERVPEYSWGKLGISFDQYRRDAVECGRRGAYRDVSNTDAARVFKRATSQLQSNESIIGADTSPDVMLSTHIISARIVEGTRPEKRIGEVRVYMEEAMNACLAERGYTRFRLTREQRRRLGHLRYGTPARHQYLFSLATDPEILSKQAVV